ncbi:MAG: DUF3368 domain-containing protein [Chroococcales cyanobacterium]
MPVVSNTSPLLNLAIIDRLYLVQQQFSEIYIPTAVKAELRVNESLPGSSALRQAIENGWIVEETVKDSALVKLLRRDLDLGEAEAIALGLELGADWTLLDEREGRKIARSLGLNITGTLGILLRGWRLGELSSLRGVTDDLQLMANFRIAPELLSEILRESGEL